MVEKETRNRPLSPQSLELEEPTGFAGFWLTILLRDILEIHEDAIEY